MSVVEFPPTNHYDYPQLDISCTCDLCSDWREKRRVFDRAKALTSHHGISCFCWRCCKRRELQTQYLSALNKRDIYCELSWYASKHTDYGSQLMRWIGTVFQNDTLGDGWWSTNAVYFPLYHFLHRFQTVHSAKMPSVSGMFLEHLSS